MCAINVSKNCTVVTGEISFFKYLSFALLLDIKAMIKEISTYFFLFKSKSAYHRTIRTQKIVSQIMVDYFRVIDSGTSVTYQVG